MNSRLKNSVANIQFRTSGMFLRSTKVGIMVTAPGTIIVAR